MHLLYHLIHLHVFFSRNFDAVMTFWRFFSCFWNGRSCGWLNVTSHFYVLAEPCRSFLGDGHAQQIFSGIFWCPPLFFSFCGQSCCVICKNWAKTCKRRQNHASVCKNSQNMGKGSKGCPFVPILVKTISCMACTVVHGWFFKENDILASCDSCVPYNMDMKPKKKVQTRRLETLAGSGYTFDALTFFDTSQWPFEYRGWYWIAECAYGLAMFFYFRPSGGRNNYINSELTM